MGVGRFHLADPDGFEVVNFNRQLGASMSTVGLRKSAASAAVAESINREAEISVFENGVTDANAEAFLCGVDIVVDGIEFFCIEARRLLYRECRKRAIPVSTLDQSAMAHRYWCACRNGRPSTNTSESAAR